MSTVDQENVSKVLSVLSHPIRREILLILNQSGETSFTDMMKALNIDTGKLSFHIRGLSIFIEQTESGKYKLNRLGEDAVRVIKDVESWAELANVDRKASQVALATFRRRTYAFLIDFGIMLILTSPLILPTLFSIVKNWIVIVFNLLFISLAILWIYSSILEGFSGQTVGKRVLGLLVTRVDGRKIDYERAAVRSFGKVLLPFDLVFGYLLHDARFIRYFDKFAGTTVIDLRRRTATQEVSTQNQVEKAESEPPHSSEN